MYAAGGAIGAATPLQRVSCFLAFYQCYTDACAGSSRRTGVSGGSGSAQRVSCLELADLVPREVHIRTELSFSAV